MASQKTAHRARVAAAFQIARADRKHFRVLEITPTKVLFFFGGYHVEFAWREGRIARIGGENEYLHPEDYAFMFLQAEMLMAANVRGLNSAKAATAAKKPKKAAPTAVQLSLFNRPEPPQGSLS
jgi:hypothetical protein